MKILLLKPSSLGDVVQALPVLRLLKQHLPQSEIYWWIQTGLAPLLKGDPDLAGLIPFDRRRWAWPRHWGEMLQSIRRMRAQHFDWVIDLQCLARSGAFAWLANGKLLVGLDEPREGARGFYDLIARRPSFHTHAVDWYLGVLPLLGVPVHANFQWLPPRPAVAQALRQKWPVAEARWVILQPGARWLNKRWPVEHFAALVRQFELGQGRPVPGSCSTAAGTSRPRPAVDQPVRFAILGGAEDRLLGQTIAKAAPERCLDLTGQLSLPEMVEWIRLSELMVSNDTGPMHVAAALNKPLVALFGPTEPRRTGPYGQLHHVLQHSLPCVPCLKSRCAYAQPLECLRALSPDAVRQAMERHVTNVKRIT